MIVKPKAGLKVRDPKTLRHLPADGIRVSDDDHDAVHHWTRQAMAGDVVLGPEPKPAPAKAPAAPPKEG
jgi:hypothetical protein